MKSTNSIRVLVCISILGGASIGCKGEAEPVGPPIDHPTAVHTSNGVLPLTPGNTWAYFTQNMDSVGAVVDTLSDVTTVLGDTLIGSEWWFYFTVEPHTLYTNRSDGLYAYAPDLTPRPYLSLKYPGAVGDAFARPYDTTKVLIVSTDTTITCQAGHFLCYRYRVAPPNGWVFEYDYAAGVGLVASTGTHRIPGPRIDKTFKRSLVHAVIR
jgi:hypothetical protein